jgi:hypothetical protein
MLKKHLLFINQYLVVSLQKLFVSKISQVQKYQTDAEKIMLIALPIGKNTVLMANDVPSVWVK